MDSFPHCMPINIFHYKRSTVMITMDDVYIFKFIKLFINIYFFKKRKVMKKR